jgi:hypothetical protein
MGVQSRNPAQVQPLEAHLTAARGLSAMERKLSGGSQSNWTSGP